LARTWVMVFAVLGITLMFGLPVTFYYLGTIGNVNLTGMAVPLIEIGGFCMVMLLAVVIIMSGNAVAAIIGCPLMGATIDMILYVLAQQPNSLIDSSSLNWVMLFIVVIFEVMGVILAASRTR
jgi:hypothetical protein